MKKFVIALLCICACSLGALCACGSDGETIDGIEMYLYENGVRVYDSKDSAAVVLSVGDEFTLSVKYFSYDGSTTATLPADSLAMKYDSDVLSITRTSEGEYDPEYSLVALCEANSTKITVSDGTYTEDMYLSFGYEL